MKVPELNEARPTVLKIGGSVVTDKEGELAARTQTINRLVEEISAAEVENLILVHGGGSFGHPVAEKYRIRAGFRDERQKIGFSETHHVMTMLNGLFMDVLLWHNIPAISITPSSCIITEDGRIRSFEDTALKMLLKMNFLPVLYGDAVFDIRLGFTILSGDQLVAVLARKFNAKRVIIGVDVDGLFNCDPKTGKTAKLFDRLTLKELRGVQDKIGQSGACDVTGGMSGKIAELIPVVEQGIPVTIVNATQANYVYKVLKGDKVKSTLIEKE
jgi:isopentenyl phosphate kinase